MRLKLTIELRPDGVLVGRSAGVSVRAYLNFCQRRASPEIINSTQGMCMVSIIEPVSSSRYLGRYLKDYCFSSSFQKSVQVREHS